MSPTIAEGTRATMDGRTEVAQVEPRTSRGDIDLGGEIGQCVGKLCAAMGADVAKGESPAG